MRSLPLTLVNDEGEEITLPTKWAICDECHGEGTHVNRAIDGFSMDDECAHDEDFMEGYLSGRYDVPCDAGCDHGKIKIVDEDHLDEATIQAYWEYVHEIRQWDQAERMERMMGA